MNKQERKKERTVLPGKKKETAWSGKEIERIRSETNVGKEKQKWREKETEKEGDGRSGGNLERWSADGDKDEPP